MPLLRAEQDLSKKLGRFQFEDLKIHFKEDLEAMNERAKRCLKIVG